MRSRRRSSAGRRPGTPDAPAAWLLTVARNRAIDRLRRQRTGQAKLEQLGARAPSHARRAAGDVEPERLAEVGDERLSMLFTCCHPALALDARVALTLQAVGGADRRRDRPRVPRPRADDGPAAGPRQAEDPRRRDRVRGPARCGAARPPDGRARRHLPDLQRGLRRDRRRRTSCDRRCAPRRCGSASCWRR